MKELPLHDIHLPEAISIWPLAIGWWILPLLILLITYIIYRLIKHKKHEKSLAYRNMSLIELKKIRSQYINSNDSRTLLRDISTLLRRTALSYLPREKIASLTGKQWINQLNALSSQTFFNQTLAELLEVGPYKAQSDFDQEELLNICELWIQALPKTKNTTENSPVNSNNESTTVNTTLNIQPDTHKPLEPNASKSSGAAS